MSTCQHGQKITKFCASECCQWKQTGGCDACMRKYHNHMGPTKFLNESQVADLLKKYVVESSVKPKCRDLQEVIYNYFSRLKNELGNFCDAVSKMMINQIGYPYLHYHKQLVPYKRLKNKQYKKLVQKDFRNLVQATSKRDFKRFLEDETKIYFQNLDRIIPLVNDIDTLFHSFERLSKQFSTGYTHDSTMINKINEIIKNIRESRDRQNRTVSQNEDITINVNLAQKSNQNPSSNMQRKQQANLIGTSRGNRDRLKDINKQLQVPRQKQKDRKVSIDKSFKKSRLTKIKTQQKEKETSIVIKEQTPSRQIYKNKEQEINEKKEKLISLMKQKETKTGSQNDSQSTKKESLKTQPPSLLIPKVQSPPTKKKFRQKDSEKDFFQKKQIPKSRSSINDLDKSKGSNVSENSGGSSQNLKQSPLDVPHAYLPRVQSKKKIFQDSAQIYRKTYIVPVQTQNNKNQTLDECQSPLMKKKKKMTNASGSPNNGFRLSEASKTPSPNKESPNKQQKIKDNQEKSLALLVKSLGMKAEQAIPHLESALRHADNNLSAAQYLSYLLLQIGRPKQCLILCNKMLERLQSSNEADELSLNLNNNKTAALNTLGRYSESIVILQKCLAYKEKDTIYKNLADAYFSIGIYQKAIYNYEKAVQLYEQYDEAHYNLAVCLFIQENYYNAKLAITRALDYAPKNPIYIELKNHINQRIQLL